MFLMILASAESFEVQGHRGTRSLRPDNTIAACSKAIDGGVTRLELDILATADNQIVIHHDFFVNKEFSCYLSGEPITKEVLIRSLTLEEVKKIDVGTKTNPAFPAQISMPGEQIPTLQELLDFIVHYSHPNAKQVRLNLDLKRDLRFPEWTLPPEKLADAVVTQVKRSGLAERVYYSSVDPEILAAVRKRDAKAEIAFIFNSQSIDLASILHPEAGFEFILEIASSLQVNILSPEEDLIKSKEDVTFMHERGFKVIPWTVNHPRRWKELFDMGVDGMISDDPTGLVYFLEKESSSKFKLSAESFK